MARNEDEQEQVLTATIANEKKRSLPLDTASCDVSLSLVYIGLCDA